MLDKQTMISAESALPGRSQAMQVADSHYVNNTSLTADPAENEQEIIVGMGCFWGAERLFWNIEGVVSTSVGYAGGYTPNPTYEEVCTGKTGHTEVVRVIFNTNAISLTELLKTFWENHNPTQGMRQGNDLGTQYRSVIYTTQSEQLNVAQLSKTQYQSLLGQNAEITTEIEPLNQYFYAEDYHQQYLAKNPNGYCGLGGTGVCFPPQN
ncbi:peptide-methionine (S)-S-oxide reductase MsrA [Vibrio sp. S4M6]|uniref:peptide-methionine (S)-S-oxide reductase MsrA n=1 Tax=Vibrio sinus TaxID=2946865 RepID=UPI00202A9F30|nr:peptide-methionine (S)-S-oxide reductase MsrA [Vibrio sinus]MCL9780497.1 peptide-methionine (S)-S-oxide reductase MsrA [Vibrio sinus]